VVAGDYYTELGRTWGPSLLSDQHTGASIMWASGEVFGLALAAVVFVQWWQASAREAARLDHAALV
jgi:cytochrome c oxidase assembly factor CtaG